MASITWARFEEVVKAASGGRARFFGSVTSPGAMVYLFAPLDPSSNERGLWEVQSIGSPVYWKKCMAEGEIIKGVMVRGYRDFFQRACKIRAPWGSMAFDAQVVKSMLPDAFNDTTEARRKLRQLYELSKTTDIKKVHDRHRWAPIGGDDKAILIDDPSYRREARKEQEKLWKPGDPELEAPR